MSFILLAILILAFLNSLVLARVVNSVSLIELRRRARSSQDKSAQALYKLASYGPSLQFALWLKGTVSAIVLMIWAARTGWLIAGLTGLVISWLAFAGRGSRRAPSWQLHYAELVAPLGAKAMGLVQPLFAKLSSLTKASRSNTMLYETEDLLNLIKEQSQQPDNRISQEDLKTARKALRFSTKKVRDIMTPRAKVTWVPAGESISPSVMDELHKTGQARFPVVKESSKTAEPQVLGSLYLQDLLNNIESGGHIRGIMHEGVAYTDEAEDLRACLEQILKSGQLLLVVKNNFDELTGVITLEDLLGQVFGKKPAAEQTAPQFQHGEPPEQTDK